MAGADRSPGTRFQAGSSRSWGIIQKQTGADRLCLGGALAANAHGRGLRYAPLVADVEAFTLVDAEGELRRTWEGGSLQLEHLLEPEEDNEIEILPNGETRAVGGSDPAERGFKKPLTIREDLGGEYGARSRPA